MAAISKGKRSVGVMRGADRKAFHQGAFWTPADVAERLHSLLDLGARADLAIVDNSAGVGRLLAGLTRHQCYGIEIDEEAVAELRRVQPHVSVETASMLDMRTEGFALALLNPPFNLTFDHARIRTLGIGRHGPLGAGARATSQYVAIALALQAAPVVVAIVPHGCFSASNTEAESFLTKHRDRLAAIVDLPPAAFAAEGTQVSTQVAVFVPARVGREAMTAADLFSDRAALCFREAREVLSTMDGRSIVFEPYCPLPPAIAALPATGAGRLRITRKGRRLVLKPDSLETYYRALDSLAGRLPKLWEKAPWAVSVRSRAYGLDLQAYLVQDDPITTLAQAFEDLRRLGLSVDIDAGFWNWFQRETRRVKRDLIPMRHWVLLDGRGQLRYWIVHKGPVHGVAKVSQGGLQIGQSYPVCWDEEKGFCYRYSETDYLHSPLPPDEQGKDSFAALLALFDFPDGPAIDAPHTWSLLHPGLEKLAPAVHSQLAREIERKGIDRWVYEFSRKDLIELAGRRSGIYNAFMSLGKTRFMFALIALIAPRHGLIVVKHRHVSELLQEYRDLGFAESELQVIDSPEKLQDLRQFNLIAYSTLIASVNGGGRTYADALRRRCAVVCSDEAHDLANPDSQRSREIERLGAKRVYLLTGYAMRGYARNVHNLARLTAGDSTPRNPYGRRLPYLSKILLHAACTAESATATFAAHFVEVGSASSQFKETLASGYRYGERPVIKDVMRFRRYTDPLVLRRVRNEPEVVAEIPEVPIDHEDVYVEPDRDQVLLYNQYLGHYSDWYQDELARHGKIRHYVEAKSRLALLHWASSFPQSKRCEGQYPHRLTALQTRLLADINDIMETTDDKIIVVFENPDQVEYMALQMPRSYGVARMHGKMTIERREEVLYDDFRDGACRILVTSAEVVSECYNLHVANWVLHADSYWVPSVKAQINMRIARPRQTKRCRVRHYIPRGLLTEYKEEFARAKDRAIAQGVDYDEPEDDIDLPTMYGVFAQLVAQYRQAA